jgi:3-oxoacyl-[acyl-carrier protein] reductase
MYHSQLQHSESDEMARNLEASIPMGRIAKPEEIAATISFLLSDEASYTTGQIHCVSGGV